MGQPYTEAPGDVFNPVANPNDWLEIIDGGASPSSTHLSNDGQEAQLVGYVPWNKQRSAARWFLGFAWADSNYTLHRNNPEAHPLFPWLYASEISFTPFNPAINAYNAQAPLQFVSPWAGNELVAINVANHRYAIATVKFRNFRYTFLDDSAITDPRMEWMRNVYLDLDPSVEVLSSDGISQLAFVETSSRAAGPPTIPAGPTISPQQTPFPAPVAELLGKATYTLNWVNVPFEYLSVDSDYFYPLNIMNCLGTVNEDNFPYNAVDPFKPGTLLFDSVKFTQKVFPVASADPASPLVSVDVSMSLKYFNPPKGASSEYYGHNLMPWRQNGLFYYATRIDPSSNSATVNTPPLLPSSTFNDMFVSPNA
jgi:hypothetical protein